MPKLNRRQTIQGAAAFGAALVCEPVAAVVVPRQSCGCQRVHDLRYGHTCIVHDETGKRWDAYTEDDVAKLYRIDFEVQTEKTDWSCHCGRCDQFDDNIPPAGTRMVWKKVSYEYDEWECDCAAALRQEWLDCQTTDWIAMAKEDGFA